MDKRDSGYVQASICQKQCDHLLCAEYRTFVIQYMRLWRCLHEKK